MDNQEYLTRIRAIIGDDAEPRGYFEGHLPRFLAQLDMWREFLDKEKIDVVLDLGTKVPFTSLYFHLTQDAIVTFGCVGLPYTELNDKVAGIDVNLNRPTRFPAVDLVICTECLEHLPSNLYKVRAYLCECVKDGKFLLLSFPLGRKNACNYQDDLPQDHEKPHDHLREFTEQTARDFYIGTGFKLVSERITFTEAYGGNIMNVLLQKDIVA